MIYKLEFMGIFRAPARVPFSAAKKEPKRCRGGHGEDYDFAYAASRSPMMALPRTPITMDKQTFTLEIGLCFET